MVTSSTEIVAASRLFSSAIFKDLAARGRSAAFGRLAKEVVSIRDLEGCRTVGDAFDAAFTVLRSVGHRSEYVYKAALTQRVLLGTHSLRTASMLTEFRIGQCKADLVILNGTATVYEVKSERDSLARLPAQLDAYRRVFARVFVIASERHASAVESVAPLDVGVLSLTRRDNISEIRPAQDRPDRICPATLFESLRVNEASRVLQRAGVSIEKVPNTKLRAALKSEFCRLDPASAHAETVNVLKATHNLAPLSSLVDELPRSLHAAALSYPIRRVDHDRIVRGVRTSLAEAREWA